MFRLVSGRRSQEKGNFVQPCNNHYDGYTDHWKLRQLLRISMDMFHDRRMLEKSEIVFLSCHREHEP
jgi:hypothetical protein